MKQETISSGDQTGNPEDGIRMTASDENYSTILKFKDVHNCGATTKSMMAVLLLLMFSVAFFSFDRPSSSTTVIEHAMSLAT